MPRAIIIFGVQLALFLAVAFGLQITFLKHFEKPLLDNQIVLAYLINFLLAFSIIAFLFSFKKKFKDQIGFLFMAGSFLKFALFFIFFYPNYKIDGEITSLEFAAFFVPYAISLILETVFIAKLLKDID